MGLALEARSSFSINGRRFCQAFAKQGFKKSLAMWTPESELAMTADFGEKITQAIYDLEDDGFLLQCGSIKSCTFEFLPREKN